jgi:hypothetical protein
MVYFHLIVQDKDVDSLVNMTKFYDGETSSYYVISNLGSVEFRSWTAKQVSITRIAIVLIHKMESHEGVTEG